MKFIAYLRQRWFEWNVSRLVYRSCAFMIQMANDKFSEELTAAEKEQLARSYGEWLCADEKRLLGLVDEPVRTVHLFLGEVIR